LWQAERAIQHQALVREKWGNDVCLLPIVAYADKTHLDTHGHHKGHPVIIKLAGWSRDMWCMPRASRLVGLLPILPKVPVHMGNGGWATDRLHNKTTIDEEVKQRRMEIHHASVNKIFEKFKAASHG
jgi:Plavaka transposase